MKYHLLIIKMCAIANYEFQIANSSLLVITQINESKITMLLSSLVFII